MKKYKHLSFEERFAIEKLFNSDVAMREIATFLKRSPNTISREVGRNMVNSVYNAKQAQLKVYQRRWRAKRQCLCTSSGVPVFGVNYQLRSPGLRS